MDLNVDEYLQSGDWSDHFFAEFNDYSTSINSNVVVQNPLEQWMNAPLEGFETANQGISPIAYCNETQFVSVNNGGDSGQCPNQYNLSEFSNAIEPVTDTPPMEILQPSSMIYMDESSIVKDEEHNNDDKGIVDDDDDDEEDELKLLQILESGSKPNSNQSTDSNNYINSGVPPTTYPIVKCANCISLFDIVSFQSHVCDYNEDNTLIMPPKASNAISKPIKVEALLPAEPSCVRLLRENQIRIRRFLKDELKYDVNASISSNNNNSTSCSSTANNSSTTSGNATSTSASTSKGGPHECTLCDRKFVHASGLLRHMEKHEMDLIPTPGVSLTSKAAAAQGNVCSKKYGLRLVMKCTLCGSISYHQNTAFKHMLSHFPYNLKNEKELSLFKEEVPYDEYVEVAISYLLVEGYEVEDTTPNIFKMVILSAVLQCEFCNLVFSNVSFLFVHSACHVPQRRFECFACKIQTRSSKEITTHWQAECVFMRESLKMNQATMQRYFVCNVCENKFQTLDQLHEHRYTSYHFFPRFNKKLGILEVPCEYCDVMLRNVADCISHYEESHLKKYKRDKDGTASGKTRQYLCDICGKSYTQSSHLWQHLRFHQGVKPYACKVPGCLRKFTIRPDLNDHTRKCHTGERPYHCLVCGKRFLTGSVFYQHRLIHRGERRYECEECGKRFYRADALKNHQRIHTGEKPFSCLFCTKNFRQRGDRDKHIRARHSHLDENARMMMQMQKYRLEQAEKLAKAAQVQTASVAGAGGSTVTLVSSGQTLLDPSEVFMIGDMQFPKSMFQNMVPIDVEMEPNITIPQL